MDDETANPGDVRFFGSPAVMPKANRLADTIEQLRLRSRNGRRQRDIARDGLKPLESAAGSATSRLVTANRRSRAPLETRTRGPPHPPERRWMRLRRHDKAATPLARGSIRRDHRHVSTPRRL